MVNIPKRKIWIFTIYILSICILYRWYKTSELVRFIGSKNKFSTKIDTVLDDEYKFLFDETVIKGFSSIRTVKIINRNPLIKIDIDNNYDMDIYKIPEGDSNGRFKDIFEISENDFSISKGVVYRMSLEKDIMFHYAQYPRSRVGRVRLIGNVDSLLSNLINDTTILYQFYLNSMAILYQGDPKQYDIVIDRNPESVNTRPPWVEMLLVQRNHNTYLIMLSSDSNNKMKKINLIDLITSH